MSRRHLSSLALFLLTSGVLDTMKAKAEQCLFCPLLLKVAHRHRQIVEAENDKTMTLPSRVLGFFAP